MSTGLRKIEGIAAASHVGNKRRNQSAISGKTKNPQTSRYARIIILLVGSVLLISGVILRPATQREGSTSSAPFVAEPISIDASFLAAVPTQNRQTVLPPKHPPLRVVIPDIRLDVSVQPSRIIGGYWEVFADRAGFGLGSAYPQDMGNQVIFAHARQGLFLPLKTVKTGQRIYVLTDERWYSYEVKEIKEVLPTQKEVIAPTTDATLTLYTCTGFADSKRLIVVAKRSAL